MINVLKEAASIAHNQRKFEDEIKQREADSAAQAIVDKGVIWKAVLDEVGKMHGQECSFGTLELLVNDTECKAVLRAKDRPEDDGSLVLKLAADVSTGAASDEEDYSYPTVTLRVHNPTGGVAKELYASYPTEIPRLLQSLASELVPWMAPR